MPDSQSSLWLAEEWARQLARALEAMTGASPPITYAEHKLAPDETDTEKNDVFWWEQRLSLAQNALVWIGASPRTWETIGNHILRCVGAEEGDHENVRSTYLEIINQALSGLAGAVSARARKEVCCAESRSAPPVVSDDGAARSFTVPLGGEPLSILMVFSDALASIADTAAAGAPGNTLLPAATAAALPAGQNARSIDLLLDVELPVSISFGRAQLALKDVIKLTTGSIVELNRSLSEPVEVIVNNCVIARGEVVVVEGNYGIRIKQVVSPQERLRTLN